MHPERIAIVTKHKCYESSNHRNQEHFSSHHNLSSRHCLFPSAPSDHRIDLGGGLRMTSFDRQL
ncbi:MAG: hypothetical protein ACJAVN_002593 [Roseivirga sp.]|jgi:hypothetical protein